LDGGEDGKQESRHFKEQGAVGRGNKVDSHSSSVPVVPWTSSILAAVAAFLELKIAMVTGVCKQGLGVYAVKV
jgi:hypothetical protein